MKKVLERVAVEDLIPYENNPRFNADAVDAVIESMRQCENIDPIEIDENNVILSGHTRRLALMQMGETETDVLRVTGLTEEQKKKYRLLANKTGELAEWDTEKLQMELEDIDFEGYDFGFDVWTDAGTPTEIIEDEPPEPKENPPFTKPGDIWTMGHHRLMCGDSTKAEDMKRLMDGVQADLCVTDPPYNIAYEGSNGLTIKNDSMPDAKFRSFLTDAFKQIRANLVPGGSFYIFHADTEGLNFRVACEAALGKVRQCLIWNKNSFTLGRQDYQWKHEPCQPAGTMVRTPNGEVPIEQLKDGDRVVSFDTYSGAVKGYTDGLAIKTAKRHYAGNLYTVRVGARATRTTDNHQFSVRFNPETSNIYCTYLMRKGKRWRVGITRTYDARGFGLKHRVDQEKAEEAWLVTAYESMEDARMGEQLLSCKYGIPQTHWEPERGQPANCHQRTKEQIDWLYEQLNAAEMQRSAERLLRDAGRSIRYPLIDESTKADRFSRRVTAKINACNLVPGLMQVPIPMEHYDGTNTFMWEAIDAVTTEPFDGTVYSLAVDRYEHYIADGIVTHNCLYGWTEGAGHYFTPDRTLATVLDDEIDIDSMKKEDMKKLLHKLLDGVLPMTVIDEDKPKKNAEHPTMKPVPPAGSPDPKQQQGRPGGPG